MRALTVLMLKHVVVRLRRFIQTIAEFVSPLMFFIILYCFRSIYYDQNTNIEYHKPVAFTEVVPLSAMSPSLSWIMYQPETPLTHSLMDDVGAKLNLKRLPGFPKNSERGYFPNSNETSVVDLAANMKVMEALVIFEDMDGETWPPRLNYTIRMKGDFQTETYSSKKDQSGPHRMYGFKYGTFMRIQWAIDTSYIKLLTGTEIPQVLSLQEFPYYQMPKNESVKIVALNVIVLSWMSLLLPFVFYMCRLLEERTSGIQELMKMVGVSPFTLGLSNYLNMLPCVLVFSIGGTILLKASSTALLPQSNPLIVFLMLMLYFNFVISLAFVCSYISRGTQYSTTLAVMIYVLFGIPYMVLPYKTKFYLYWGLIPNMPMHWFWIELAELETHGIGAQFDNIGTVHVVGNSSILLSFIFTVLQSVICYCLTWYLSLVRPGHFGQALPWNFCFQAKYWSKNEVMPQSEGDHEDLITHNPAYFEPAPKHAEVGIKVINVSKVYPKHRALKNVSLEVYKGEITVLLGHNGAGKTTLMSIITGMTSATEGKVYVNGKDTVTQSKEVRQQLGLCMQQNLFFDHLTVQQHIMFFTLLKRGNYSEAKKSTRVLAERLSLTDKLNALVTPLSGGMKRRVQLACALAGGADVLVLDEPTSGLDVETRRELWDMLLSLRGERTLLLTTHFMEEADALGDRVAALHNGVLTCFATTMHLKKAVGTGYRLSFTTFGTPQEAAITQVVTSHITDATMKEQTINSISYNLASAQTSKFPQLFADLEAKRSELGIDSIGVGVSTLEEVFLKLCSDIDVTLTEDEVDQVGETVTPPTKYTGAHLYAGQFYTLLARQAKYAYNKKWYFLVLQFALPVFITSMVAYGNNNVSQPASASRSMDLAMYGDREQSRALLAGLGARDLATLRTRYPHIAFQSTADAATEVLRSGKKDILEYNKYLVGVEVNETDAKILYTTIVRHTAPAAVNLLSNILAARYISWSDGKTITTINDPISRALSAPSGITLPKEEMRAHVWGFVITFTMFSTFINALSLPCQERRSGVRHIHLMSGCPAELHWLATLLVHVLCAQLLVLIYTAVACIFEKDKTIDQPEMLVALAFILLLGQLSFFPFSYLISFNYEERGTGIILVGLIIVFGVITPLMKIVEDIHQTTTLLTSFLPALGYFMPPHTAVLAVHRCIYVATAKARCTALRPVYCPDANMEEISDDLYRCCAGEDPLCYYCIDKMTPGEGMYVLFMQFLVMMPMVFLTQRGVFNALKEKVMKLRYNPVEPAEQDKMVRAEKAYVSKAITLPPKQIPDAMLVHDLHKNYVSLLSKNINAVRGVSFSVKKGECFGLLGVNGAGKSTTFKLLTAEETPTRGKIFGNGYHSTRGKSQYFQTLGYCPQFSGVDTFLTGEENLSLVLTLRGFDRKYVKAEVENWLKIVGLERYAKQRVESYSGGCARRLAGAVALCGGAYLVLLDEPSAGVDVAARRRLWVAIRKAQRQQRSIIITSHSMDETEALCKRIAILSRGRVRALGSAAGLRAAHATGHAVVIKVAHADLGDQVDGGKTEMHRLKGRLREIFNCSLKDEHQTMLHYHINETMRYSDLFRLLESIRNEFPALIEDFSVTETTLEEVFLSFAKELKPAKQTKPQTGGQSGSRNGPGHV